jgi:L-ascorbate metabolism protein UlaG (beta-lactamase superfamily)
VTASLQITRVINACALLELGADAVLTDPYFTQHWFMRFREPIGLAVHQLPKLSAIIGGHSVFDHWQPSSMATYCFKDTTPVFVATKAMKSKAKAAGFTKVEVLEWGERRRLSSGLELEVAPAQTAMGLRVNNYVLSSGGLRVFFGSEARDLEPLRRYRSVKPGVHVVLVPIDGAQVMGHKLVMNGSDALEAARILGARVLVPIHYALKPVPVLLQTPGSEADLRILAQDVRDLEVVYLKTGERWHYGAPRADGIETGGQSRGEC